MKKMLLSTMFFAIIAFVLVCSATAQSISTSQTGEEISIIPMPAHLQQKRGSFNINKDTKIVVQQGNGEALRIAKMLAVKFQQAAGLTIRVNEANDNSSTNSIYFTTAGANDTIGKEGYQLSVTNGAVIVRAKEPAGLFYGMQTICQLLPAAIESSTKVDNISWKIPAVEITDVPRFVWRGQHLDVSRHFVSVAFIKKYIDN